MVSILGIDAAWTSTEPSGVALIAGDSTSWRVLGVAPSFESFVTLASGKPVDWTGGRFGGTSPNVTELLSAARSLGGADPILIAIDMPVATTPN
jgi:predicted RNase H-like nuclease